MGDVRELLARLNPATIRLDIGRGGLPELTNQDVAAALAFVPAGLGREVLEACWWPDGAALRRRALRDAVLAVVREELTRQEMELVEAKTDLGIVQACIGWHSAITSDLRVELSRATARLESARQRRWPQTIGQMLPALTMAVIGEIARPAACPVCEGRGERMAGDLRVPCAACGGSGRMATSDRRRAVAIDRDESSYRATWRPVYEWLLSRMQEAESEAATRLRDALKAA